MDHSAVNKVRSYFEDLIHDRVRLVKCLLIIFLLMSALVLRIHETNKADITLEDNTSGTKAGGICVDIGGAVVKPGVYTVSENTRLYEVIELAGGLLSNGRGGKHDKQQPQGAESTAEVEVGCVCLALVHEEWYIRNCY